MEQAWFTARLNAYAPPKSEKFFKLKDLLVTSKSATPRQQTADEQLAIARSWVASRHR